MTIDPNSSDRVLPDPYDQAGKTHKHQPVVSSHSKAYLF